MTSSSGEGQEYRLRPGQRFGDYRILASLGQGGMGQVYEAEHVESGHRLAVKILTDALPSLHERQRFLREGLLAASVNDPHCLYVYGTEEVDGTPLIAMELAPGGTLAEVVEANGPLAPEDAVAAVLQIADGLAAAHAAGVLHRDVKPSNCYLGIDGTVKVGDFGLSIPRFESESTRLTATGMFLGTPAYAPPEQLRAEATDARSDIYSLGGTLYFLLAGEPPFEGESGLKLMASILEKVPPTVRSRRREVSRGLDKIVSACLAKSPDDRPRDWDDFRRRLRPFASDAFEAAGPVRRTLAVGNWLQRIAAKAKIPA